MAVPSADRSLIPSLATRRLVVVVLLWIVCRAIGRLGALAPKRVAVALSLSLAQSSRRHRMAARRVIH